ncbi:hypothetical protein CK222_04550 [Mesorhizobium sp. WSM3866]|nr:hypothetical protein CK222_04550 [Mesorhizobium sp. WSM3866]
MLPVRYLHIRAAISSGEMAAVLPVISLVEPMRHMADKMQIWRRNFLSMFASVAQFGGSLRSVCRHKRQSRHARRPTQLISTVVGEMLGRAEGRDRLCFRIVIPGRSKERSDARRPWNLCRDVNALRRLENILHPGAPRQKSRHGSSGQARG